MIQQRAAGILLHITSLPSVGAVGDLGPAAREFVDFLARAGQAVWQILPLGPTIHGNSPYSCYSAFAGNPLLVSISDLAQDGLLSSAELSELSHAVPSANTRDCDYELARSVKGQALQRSHETFRLGNDQNLAAEFEQFRTKQADWLTDYALFAALMKSLGTDDWSQWDTAVIRRDEQALQSWRARLGTEIEFEEFVQFMFWRQWTKLRHYAHSRNVLLFGDMPIFVAHGSADVWSHQDLFHLDHRGRQTVVAGVPPDYFSTSGQLWGNPLYDWNRLAETGYDWWVRRFGWAFENFDLLRIDHFRGFESYWEVPAEATTAVGGRWVSGPGRAPFDAARNRLGDLPIVAEDLGLITDEVHELRADLDFPGMRVLQFGFDQPGDFYHRPDHYPEQCVAYTGTHDNHTLRSWYERQKRKPDVGGRIDEYLLTADHA
jgi:4-alpha-glucanotransferase